MAENQPLLFERFPELSGRISWLDFNLQVAPVQKLELSAHDDTWIKRNDLISGPIGGNKIRRLEFILGEAINQKKKHIITHGGIGSNHCLAVAICCHMLNLKCTLCLFDQPLTGQVRENLLRPVPRDSPTDDDTPAVGRCLHQLTEVFRIADLVEGDPEPVALAVDGYAQSQLGVGACRDKERDVTFCRH